MSPIGFEHHARLETLHVKTLAQQHCCALHLACSPQVMANLHHRGMISFDLCPLRSILSEDSQHVQNVRAIWPLELGTTTHLTSSPRLMLPHPYMGMDHDMAYALS